MRHIRATILAVEKELVLHIPKVWVCSLGYLEWNVLAPYCCLWPLCLYWIFSHCVIDDTMFKKKLLNIKCVFWFSLNFCLKHFLFWEELSEVSKIYIGLHVKYPLFLSDFDETWILSIFKKYSNIRFHENPSSGSQVVPCRQANMMKLIVAFHNFVNVPKNYVCEINITGWESSH